jgi:Pyruvate/2-oxoacid:ferredoxin oxidoreductase delta subunit
MTADPYKRLAEHLDALPHGFPPTADGRELKVLAKIFTPEEAELAAQLGSTPETADEIAARTGIAAQGLNGRLKAMAHRGLIDVGVQDGRLVFKSMPFVVGIYEMQVPRMDAELARLAEDYFRGGFDPALTMQPAFTRVIPVHDTVHDFVEVQPFESAAELVQQMQAWAVQECICRKQQALLGQACKHPIDVCLAMAPQPNTFDHTAHMRALSGEQAMGILRQAAEAGLVHTVSNTETGIYYICNCCTCSCGVLRGIAAHGAANVVARSAFVNQVDALLCNGCEACIAYCQFEALSMQAGLAVVEYERCLGCGVCVLTCSTEALGLIRRPESEVLPIPHSHQDWRSQRLAARGL